MNEEKEQAARLLIVHRSYFIVAQVMYCDATLT